MTLSTNEIILILKDAIQRIKDRKWETPYDATRAAISMHVLRKYNIRFNDYESFEKAMGIGIFEKSNLGDLYFAIHIQYVYLRREQLLKEMHMAYAIPRHLIGGLVRRPESTGVVFRNVV